MAGAMIDALKKPAMVLFTGLRSGKTFLFTNFEEYMRQPGEKSVEDFEKFIYKKYGPK